MALPIWMGMRRFAGCEGLGGRRGFPMDRAAAARARGPLPPAFVGLAFPIGAGGRPRGARLARRPRACRVLVGTGFAGRRVRLRAAAPPRCGRAPVAAAEGLGAEEGGERPAWAPKWLPEIVVELGKRPVVQLVVMLGLYALHIFFFSTHGWKLKKPLIANEKGLFKSIGYDSVVGAVVAAGILAWRGFVMNAKPLIPKLMKNNNPPWKVPREARRRIPKITIFLILAYLASGYGAVIIEQVLFLLAGYGVPLTVPTTRAWKVLLGHLMWVYMGVRILRRLAPFFPPKGTWLRWKWKSNWLWWATGGYYVSALSFIIADNVNRLALPSSLFDEETVVTKLINPEGDDRWAMAIGSIGPCITAPVFEEVLYRGFLLPTLTCYFPLWAALPVSSVVFALHHMNPTGIIPLTVLGLMWALIYTKSRNLLVTILIHAMWNTRVFLGSLLNLGNFTDFE